MRHDRSPRVSSAHTVAANDRGRTLARCGSALLVLVVFGVAQVYAQPFPRVRLSAVDPPGARQGSTVEVTLQGEALDDLTTLYFSDPHLKAERLPTPAPSGKNPPPAPIRFRITVPAETPLGVHDIRAIGKWGISNPRAFVVGDLEEVQEKEPNNDTPEAQTVTLNRTVNGTIATRTDVDYYRFTGKKGQRVVVHCAASSIDSRLDPLLEMFSPQGKRLAFSRNYRSRDAVVDVFLPGDGEYLVRVCDFTYLVGKADETFYRLRLTTAPWIDVVYPPVVEKGKATLVTLYGRNLPGSQPEQTSVTPRGLKLETARAKVQVPAVVASQCGPVFSGTLLPRMGTLDGFEYRTRNDSGVSNPALLLQAHYPVILEAGDNDTPEKAQPIKLPCTLCGRIENKNDRDWYSFSAKKGEVYVLEGYGDRLRAPVDLYFRLRGPDKKQIVGEADDNSELPTVAAQLWTSSQDPKYRFVVPADGDYELLIGSWTAMGRAGPRSIYSVTIGPEKPDFSLLLIDNAESGGGFTVERGGHQDLKVVCIRHDGFDGEIVLEAEGLPPGLTCVPQVAGPRVKEVSLVVTARADAPFWAGAIRIKGTAQIEGKPVVRPAHASTLVWPTPQKNQPAISRLARSVCLAIRDKGPYTLETSVQTLELPVGGRGEVKLTVNRQWPEFKNATVQLVRVSAPVQSNGQLINIPNTSIPGNKAEVVVKFQVPTNTPPGTYNLVFEGRGKFSYQPDPRDKKKKQNLEAVESTPPIRFTVYNSVAELSLMAPQVVLRPGGEAALGIKVKRLHGYKGEFKVEVVAPPGAQGVSAASITIPAGANEGRAVLKAPPQARSLANASFLVRATARVDNLSLKEETKFLVSVSTTASTGGGVSVQPTPLLPQGSAGWKYQAASKVKGDTWTAPTFDDKSWLVGKAPVGYGEEELTTRKGTVITLKEQEVLFRHELEVPAELLAQKGVQFSLTVASDDSALVYLNGQLIDQDPTADHEFAYWNREIVVPLKHLKPGKNVVAVRVKNGSGSSDLYFDLALSALVPKPTSTK